MEFKVFEQLWFPTPVWEVPVTGIDNESIKDYCLQTREKLPGTTISNRGGWHSKDILTPLPSDLEQLFSDMELFVNDVCRRHTGAELMFGNFWLNINNKHDYNLLHDHQKSILSGVYYVSVPEDNMGDLVLHRGDNADYFLQGNFSELTMMNAPNCTKKPVESTFYIFPSWIKHHVERNESDKERISIAFNFVPKK
jgi:uncharacterized protein (TIGR02466 family)